MFPATFLAQEKKMLTIVIDAGHGGKDPGARGATIDEKVINLSVALKLGKLISDNHKDVKVIYTRKTDVFIELGERANIANRNHADLFISIHANAVQRRSASGTETFTLGLDKSNENLEVAKRENSVITLEENYLQKYNGFDPNSAESYIVFQLIQNAHMDQSINLASDIQKAFSEAKRGDRGVKQAPFLVLVQTSMPSVLIELGFISNREEERYLKSANGQNTLVKSIYGAFAKYKREYDKRQKGDVVKSAPPVKNDPVKSDKEKALAEIVETPPSSTAGEQLVYKVQLFASSKQLSPQSRELKGYAADFYKEDGLYKYTIGKTNDLEDIKNMKKMVEKDFKNAFIVVFKEGKRIKIIK